MSSQENDPRQHRLERLLEVSRSLGSSSELDEMLQSVVDAACELTDSESSSILLYEAETDLLKFVAGTKTEKEVLKRLRVPLDSSIAGKVYTQGKSLLIQNARTDPQMYRDVERELGATVVSMVAVPMVFRGDTIGTLEAVNKHNGYNYTGEDVTILETLASQAAVAILSTLMLEEMQSAYKELEESERKKTDFIAIASHELRTPLGLILGHASYLYDTCRDEEIKRGLEVIMRSATKLKKIIEDFSTFKMLKAGTGQLFHKECDLAALARSVLDSFRETALRSRISLMADLPPGRLIVDGDLEKLSLVISNLMENALTFTNPGGHVLLSGEKLPGYVKISVIDDGIGIPAKDLPRVFDRFYQVEDHLTRRHGGMGLGLAVAKAMIEMHHGQIWVESVEGKGSNFSFLLPAHGEGFNDPTKIPAFL
jgi:signal transduction histidine kinase